MSQPHMSQDQILDLKTFVKEIAAGGTTGQPGVSATLHT